MTTRLLPDDMIASRAVPRFAELSVVTLVHPVAVGDRALPAGALGAVVAVYADGLGYEVEFEAPFHAVVTLDAADLTA